MALRRALLPAAASIAVLWALMIAASAAPASDRRDVFTVAAVHVDVTAGDANAAREQARHDGERQAYGMLLDRLTRAADRDRLPSASDAILNTLVGSYEVANERRSSVRYIADYTYHFRPDAVRRLLNQAGVPFAETPSKPVVVLAVLDAPSGPVLWEDPNPWREAWAARPLPQGLVPLIVPLAGLEDIAAIDAATAEQGDAARLQAISQRYGGVDVLVSRATLQTVADPHSVSVSSKRDTPGAGENDQTWIGSYTAQSGESDADLLARAVAGTVAQVEEAWKSANMVDYGHGGTLTVTVPVSDLQSWMAIRDRLAGIAVIQSSELVSLDRKAARLSLRYLGDPAQLRLALAQHDLDLSGEDPNWVLARRGAAGAE
jgi:hypothetical protein